MRHKLSNKNYEDNIKVGDTVYYIDYRAGLHDIPARVVSHNTGHTDAGHYINENVKVYKLDFKGIGIKNIPYYSIVTKAEYFKLELDKTLME